MCCTYLAPKIRVKLYSWSKTNLKTTPKPHLVDSIGKMHHGIRKVEWFARREWTWANDNVISLSKELGARDRAQFNFQMDKVRKKSSWKGTRYLINLCNCVPIDRLARVLHQLLDSTPHTLAQIQARHPGGKPGAVAASDTLLQCRQGAHTCIVSYPRLSNSREGLWAPHHDYAKNNKRIC